MTTITPSPLSLDDEHLEALDSLVAKYNQSAVSAVSREEYLSKVLDGVINAESDRLYKESAGQLVAAAAKLPYNSRLALISQIESSIGA